MAKAKKTLTTFTVVSAETFGGIAKRLYAAALRYSKNAGLKGKELQVVAIKSATKLLSAEAAMWTNPKKKATK